MHHETTITHDRLLTQLKRRAAESGTSVGRVVDEAVRMAHEYAGA